MTTVSISRYTPPSRWIHYDKTAILQELVEAKTAAGVLGQLPYLSQWIESAVHAFSPVLGYCKKLLRRPLF